MPDQRIRKNQITDQRTIIQNEHEEALDAKRVTLVNEEGEAGVGSSPDNPIHVQLSDGSINVGTVNAELEVQLSHKDNDPDNGDVHDSVRIGDGQNEVTMTPSQDLAKVGMNTINLASVFTKPYNRVRVSSKNDDGDPTEIITSFGGVDVQSAAILYDSDGDFQDLQVTDL